MTESSLSNLPVLVLKSIISGLLEFWWLWLLVLLIFIGTLVLEKKIKGNKYSAINNFHNDRQQLNELRSLTPLEFEDYIAHLFSKLGFTTETVGGAYDGGIDVIATKNNVKHYIQCKKFITSQVDVGSVRNFYGALVDHLANGKGYFITTNKFTLEAEKFAEDKPIELIDGYRLMEYIKSVQDKGDSMRLINEAEEKCPQCNGKLIEKRGKYGKFFGCSNFPKCRFIKKRNS